MNNYKSEGIKENYVAARQQIKSTHVISVAGGSYQTAAFRPVFVGAHSPALLPIGLSRQPPPGGSNPTGRGAA